VSASALGRAAAIGRPPSDVELAQRAAFDRSASGRSRLTSTVGVKSADGRFRRRTRPRQSTPYDSRELEPRPHRQCVHPPFLVVRHAGRFWPSRSRCPRRASLVLFSSRSRVGWLSDGFSCEQLPSNSISAVLKRGPHVPGPPSKVIERPDCVCREAPECAVPKRYNANRHLGDSDRQGWKRQGGDRNEQGKRQTDLKCERVFIPSSPRQKRTDFFY
jgi:hypothetical protein